MVYVNDVPDEFNLISENRNFLTQVTEMKKQQTKQKPLKSHAVATSVSENAAPMNQAHGSFFQSKPSFSHNAPDISGTWKTCGENIILKRSADADIFEGQWGVHVMKFAVEDTRIPKAYLGGMELMFDGELTDSNRCINWGNGQKWFRA
jgi:hypothetical protein